MSDDKQWKEMMNDWQSCEIAKVESVQDFENIKQLQDKTRKKAFSMKCFMWADILSAVVITGVYVYLMFDVQSELYMKVLFGGSLFLIIPMAFLSVWYRKGAWVAIGNDTKAYLELALMRNISAIKLAHATAIVAIFAGLFFVTLVILKGMSQTSGIDWPLYRYILGGLAQFILFGGMYYGSRWYQKRKLVEQKKINSMLKEFEED